MRQPRLQQLLGTTPAPGPRPARKRALICGLMLAAGLGGCRLEPGPTDYASQSFDEPGADAGMEMGQSFLPGPDPYGAGETRLVFGPYYEGASSTTIAVDDVNNFLFVFQTGGQSTLSIDKVDDRVEGFEADRLTHQGTGFWGTSIAFFDGNPDEGGEPRPEDLSRYTTLHISLKSSDAAFAQVDVGVASSAGEGKVAATSYGYQNDGQWHTLAIPLEDLEARGVNLGAVTTPLILGGGPGPSGAGLLVDSFYWTAE